MKHAKPFPEITPKLLKKFWDRVEKTEDGCWEWKGYFQNKGRPVLDVVTKKDLRITILAHRFSCFLHHGPPPLDKPDALHSCDYKPCTNPRHLRWGTNGENRRDWYERGDLSKFIENNPKGSNNGQSKLIEEDVLDIRLMLKKGVFQYLIAEQYGVHQSIISNIKNRRTWRHV